MKSVKGRHRTRQVVCEGRRRELFVALVALVTSTFLRIAFGPADVAVGVSPSMLQKRQPLQAVPMTAVPAAEGLL